MPFVAWQDFLWGEGSSCLELLLGLNDVCCVLLCDDSEVLAFNEYDCLTIDLEGEDIGEILDFEGDITTVDCLTIGFWILEGARLEYLKYIQLATNLLKFLLFATILKKNINEYNKS